MGVVVGLMMIVLGVEVKTGGDRIRGEGETLQAVI